MRQVLHLTTTAPDDFGLAALVAGCGENSFWGGVPIASPTVLDAIGYDRRQFLIFLKA